MGRLCGMRFETTPAMDEMIDWPMFCNHGRLYSIPGYISPLRFERNWFAARLRDAA